MGPKDVLRGLFISNDYVMNEYLKDLSDADLLLRPAAGANHAAWQLGHLINSEGELLKIIPGAKPCELPAGWAEKYTKDTAKIDPPVGFATKAEYLAMYQKVRANSLKTLEAYPEAALETKTEGRMAGFAPNHAAVFALIANHPMMHAGQIAVLRRKLGKPIVI